MTKEQAIKVLNMVDEAKRVAIKALKQEPCEDAISREAVHDLLATWLSDYLTDETREALETIDEKVADLPSVNPQPKTGHWIKSNIGGAKVCSVCNAHIGLSSFKFCPNCGARMEN